jgi:glycosyltransferase involved in cell wall biosynthesis
MRIVVISDHETAGGAATAGARLVRPLAERHEVHYLVHNPDHAPHPWKTWPLRLPFPSDPKSYRSLYPVLDHGWKIGPCEPKERAPATLPLELNARLRWLLDRIRPDIVWLHNIHGATIKGWSAEMAQVASYFAPVVWTLHDMWSFTGRCAYNYDCRAFETGCHSRCPTASEYPALDPALIPDAWTQRQRVLRQGLAIRAVTPSRWLAQEATRGAWPTDAVDVISTGIDLNIYQPLDRIECRTKHHLPNDGRPIILVSAHDLNDRRKGGTILPELLRELKTRPAVLVLMGQGNLQLEIPGIETVPLGFIREPRAQAEIYSAVDLMLHPAPVDNLPNVIIESLACGTPVVAYPVGGITEMVYPTRTGWLAGSLSPKGLAQTLDRALWQTKEGQTLRDSCRSFALAHYDEHARSNDYEQLFIRLCSRHPFNKPKRSLFQWRQAG